MAGLHSSNNLLYPFFVDPYTPKGLIFIRSCRCFPPFHCQVDHCDARGVAKPAALGIAHRGSGPAWRSTCLTYQWATGKWSEVDEVDNDGMNFCIHLFIYLIHLPLFSWNGIILHLFQYRLVKWGGEMASTCGCRWYGNTMPWRGVSWATTESAITTAIRTATTRDNPQERQEQHLESPQHHHHHHFFFCYIPVQHANCKLADATMTMCPWFNHSNRKASNVQLCFFETGESSTQTFRFPKANPQCLSRYWQTLTVVDSHLEIPSSLLCLGWVGFSLFRCGKNSSREKCADIQCRIVCDFG